MSDLDKSFQSMMLDKNGFGKELYDAVSKVISMPHSYRYGELDKNGVYYALYTVIASRVSDIKSYEAMLNTNNPGGIEKELYLAAQQINAEEEYELIVNKVNDIFNAPNPDVCYPNVTAVKNEFLKYAFKEHNHEVDNVNGLISKLDNLTLVDNNLSVEIDTKQDELVSGVNIKKLSIDEAEIDLTGEGTVIIPTGSGGASSYKSLPDIPTVEGHSLKSSSDGDNSAESLGLATKVHNHNVSDVTDLETVLNNKQDKLESGVNIRPIQVGTEAIQSLLGNEVLNIPISEGGTEEIIIKESEPDETESLGKKLWFKQIVSATTTYYEIYTRIDGIWKKLEESTRLDYPHVTVGPLQPVISGVKTGDIWFKEIDSGIYEMYFCLNIKKEGEPPKIGWIKVPRSATINNKTVEGNHTGSYYNLANLIMDVPNPDPNNYELGTVWLNDSETSFLYDINVCCKDSENPESKKWVGIEEMIESKMESKINNVNIMGKDLTSHDINVPLLKGEVIINRLEPQTILTDVGVLWVDCRKIRLRTVENMVWVLASTPTPEDLQNKSWITYPHAVVFTSYQGGDPLFPDPTTYEVGDIVIDYKPNTAETDSNIYINTLKEDNTTLYWRKLPSQDGYGHDPMKPSINGVHIAGARTGQAYKLQDQLESGVNIRPIQIGASAVQSILGSEVLHIPAGEEGVTDYNLLTGLPVINKKVLKGKLTSTDLNIPLTADNGNCIIARNETYIPMLQVGTIWLDLFRLMEKKIDAAKIIIQKETGEKTWANYDKSVYYDERDDPEYVPEDITHTELGDICVVWNKNLVPVYWRVFKLELIDGKYVWVRMNVIYSYSQIPDKPVVNGHRFAGSGSGRLWNLANMYDSDEVSTADLENGDFKIEEDSSTGVNHTKISVFNSASDEWGELLQLYSGGDFSPALESRFRDKQDRLDDSEGGKNTAKIVVNGVSHKIINTRDDIVINTEPGRESHNPVIVQETEPEISTREIGDLWFKPVSAEHKFEIYILTETKEGEQVVRFAWERLESQLNYKHIPALDDEILSVYNKITSAEEDISHLQTGMSAVEGKICTEFDVDSTNTSPSCKAIADYFNTLLNNLTEEAF